MITIMLDEIISYVNPIPYNALYNCHMEPGVTIHQYMKYAVAGTFEPKHKSTMRLSVLYKKLYRIFFYQTHD